MKINYDFYKGEDLYSDGDIENEIIEYARKYKNIDEVFEKDIRWPVFYHLTPIRKNILNWYPFKENSSVLEIGAGMGAITEVLCEKCKEVVSVELSKNRAKSIAVRNEDKENLEIIVGNLNDIDFKGEKFDYITLIGVFEYAALYTNTENPYNDFLNNIKKLLKEDGKLLIAIENKFGMKYFAGAPEDHTNIAYDGITGYTSGTKVRTFGKQELKDILQENNLGNIKFYYPLPDYKLPSLMFSDEYLPTEETIEKYIPYYYENSQIDFDEIKAYKQVIKNNMFDFFANSFFVEASQKEIETKINLENVDLIKISEVSKSFYNKEYGNRENLQDLKREKEKISMELESIKISRTWKMMEPVRKLKNKFKRGN